MPRLWDHTIETHRRAVRDATLDTAADLVARHGLRSVTMAHIAEETGIGRATLYKYFPDVESILRAWHERQLARHLEQLAQARETAHDAGGRLVAVLEAYALARHESGRHGADIVALLHADEHVVAVHRRLLEMVRGLIAEAAAAGDVRADVAPGELADFCIGALATAARLPSRAAVHRLVAVTVAGLRPPQ